MACPPAPWRSYTPPAAVGGGRPRRGRFWALVLTLTGVTAGAVVWGGPAGTGQLTAASGLGPGTAPAGADGWPAPGVEASGAPLGVPAAVTGASLSFAFLGTQADGVAPVAYDPCRPVHVVVGGEGAPAGGEQVLAAAIANVAAATGLRFVLDGATDEQAAQPRELFQPDRYGDRWAPVLIAWERERLNPDLAAAAVGLGGSSSVSVGSGPSVLVSGQVELDAAQLGEVMARPGGMEQARAIVQHELGHLVGLAHVADPAQVMFPEASQAVTEFGDGDRAGLAALGRGQCEPGV